MALRKIFSSSFFYLLLLWGVSLYFFYHALYGQRGYNALLQKRMDLMVLKQKALYLEKNCTELQQKVELLEENIDEDLLEQQLWKKLCFLPGDKKVLLLESSEKKYSP